jgi:hypothetical protein
VFNRTLGNWSLLFDNAMVLQHLHKSMQCMGVALPTAAMTRPIAQILLRTRMGYLLDGQLLGLKSHAEIGNEQQESTDRFWRISLFEQQTLELRKVIDQRTLGCIERMRSGLSARLIYDLRLLSKRVSYAWMLPSSANLCPVSLAASPHQFHDLRLWAMRLCGTSGGTACVPTIQYQLHFHRVPGHDEIGEQA